MNIQNLRYVLEIVEQSSISAAARKLFISQPYLSKILMEVEKEYGITIFSREKNNLVLTEHGAAFARNVKEILDTIDGFDRNLHRLHDDRHLTFSSCPTALTSEAYLDFLQAQKNTPLRVNYREGDNDTVINDVYTRTSEFGIIVMNNEELRITSLLLKSMGLVCETLFSLEFYMIARIGHPLARLRRPLSLDDLYSSDLVLYTQYRTPGNSVAQTAQYEYSFSKIDWNRIRHITYVQSRAQYYDLIQRTDAISFGFQPFRNQEMQRQIVSLSVSPEFRAALEKDADSSVCCIYTEGHTMTSLADEFLRYMKADLF